MIRAVDIAFVCIGILLAVHVCSADLQTVEGHSTIEYQSPN